LHDGNNTYAVDYQSDEALAEEALTSELSLAGNVAVVTGAGKGIGRAIALELAGAGADVVLAARTESDINELATEIRGFGRRALAVPTDVSDSGQVDDLIKNAIEVFGKIDVMVNNAGFILRLPLVPVPGGVPEGLRVSRTPDHPITDQEWDGLMATNVNGVMYGCRAVAPHMLERGSGKIINVSSIQGKRAVPHTLAYSVSKAAVNMLTRVLALEWAAHGVQVNAICPGAYETAMSGDQWQVPEKARRAAATIPMGRPGHLPDLGSLAVYLASSASDYMTGETIYIDGGIGAE
jgi:NAD(P)-dependent dehydrogenase (short-subunit alcohol dehydrogenase family)